MQGFQAAYAELYGKAKHIVVKPGDKVPITGLDWRIVTSAGKVLKTPLPGGGKPNPACATFTPKEISNDRTTTRSRSAAWSRSVSSAWSISATCSGTRSTS